MLLKKILLEYKYFLWINKNTFFTNNKVIKNNLLLIKYKIYIALLYYIYNNNNIIGCSYNINLQNKWYNYILSRLKKNAYNISWIKSNNYSFWHIFNNDIIIKNIINLSMKDGKKWLSYKHLFKSFFF